MLGAQDPTSTLNPMSHTDSKGLYDRHEYILYFKDGRSIRFEDYEYMRSFWMAHAAQKVFSHVEVVDPKKKGFG